MELSNVTVARMLLVPFGNIEKTIHFHEASFLSQVNNIPRFSFCVNTRFFSYKIFLWENEPQNPKKLKKKLRKSPATDAWAEILKNADFS